MKIAVIGSGISGLSAAYYLSKKHTVDLFEKENHFGGHAHTINISYEEKKRVAVDVGFILSLLQKLLDFMVDFIVDFMVDFYGGFFYYCYYCYD